VPHHIYLTVDGTLMRKKNAINGNNMSVMISVEVDQDSDESVDLQRYGLPQNRAQHGSPALPTTTATRTTRTESVAASRTERIRHD
jgi:hypothetical protein